MQNRLIRALPFAIAIAISACAAKPSPAPTIAEPRRAQTSTPEAPASATDEAQWVQAVHAESAALRSTYPDATVRIVVLDVATGRVLAQEGPVDAVHDTGSTMKSLTVAAALVAGATAETEVDCSAPMRIAGREVSDHAVHGRLTVQQALARSSNVAIARLADRLGWKPLYETVRELVPLPDPAGLDEGTAVAILYGGTSRLTTLDLAHAYAILANAGRDPTDGSARLDPRVADDVLTMLRYAVTSEEGTGRAAAVSGIDVAGKTGTAQVDGRNTALFVGLAQSDEDRRVVAVVLEGVAADATGANVAAPSFARLVATVLAPTST